MEIANTVLIGKVTYLKCIINMNYVTFISSAPYNDEPLINIVISMNTLVKKLRNVSITDLKICSYNLIFRLIQTLRHVEFITRKFTSNSFC